MNGRLIAACALAVALLALSGKAAMAQSRGQDRGRDRGQDTMHESANGANSQGGHTPNEADRQVIRQNQFNERDREVTREWYQRNRTRQGWRDQDRLSASMQGRLRPGQRLDPELRQRVVWLPPELSGRYAPAPRGYRYAVIGGNVVMLDDMYEVRDMFRLDVQIGGGRSDRNDGWDDRPRRSFNNNDRQVTRDWYRQHRRSLGRGWRERDRLSPEMQARLRPGRRLDPDLRQQMVWLPPELSRRYGPAPRGYRYAIIGGNVVMVDDGYQVHDVFSITLRL